MISKNEYNAKSRGGTELSIEEHERWVPAAEHDGVQIIPSRLRSFEPGMKAVLWVHDTENDPEMAHLADSGWRKFEKLVFVSNWQMQRFIDKFEIPWNKCVVINNAIEEFDAPAELELSGTTRFIYHTTPHRGLDVLVAAFKRLADEEDVKLDVYSSFKTYGWEERDRQFEPLYDAVRAIPSAEYHGHADNAEVRAALQRAHAFVYPCTWPETGCRALMEAMMAGVFCATSNYGCLYETGAGIAKQFQYSSDKNELAGVAYAVMKNFVRAVKSVDPDKFQAVRRMSAKNAEDRYSWVHRSREWVYFLRSLRGVQ